MSAVILDLTRFRHRHLIERVNSARLRRAADAGSGNASGHRNGPDNHPEPPRAA
jgi:hypothetical protein